MSSTPDNDGGSSTAPETPTKIIYAVYDNVADDILGGLHIHRHEAAAIRFYGDIATLPDSLIGKHPQDFDLVQLGHINRHGRIVGEFRIVLTGAQWAAAQQPRRTD